MKLVLFAIFLANAAFVTATPQVIPKQLKPCYQKELMETIPKPPLNIPLLVELLRKVEFQQGNALNLRILTTSMLHAVAFNGIVQTTTAAPDIFIPYQVLGEHFYKYSLLVDYFTMGDKELFPEDFITTKEICLLHKVISNTLRSKKRGDENEICPQSKAVPGQNTQLISSPQVSDCPIEMGIIQTKWGNISPFHIIATIASALQETRERFNNINKHLRPSVRTAKSLNITNFKLPTNLTKRINLEEVQVSNIWLASITGDLAEVVINQVITGSPIIATDAFWNDTLYPRNLYLSEREWDMSEGEMLGGLDAAILSNKVKEWVTIMENTRLSQIIDMYYSNRGIGYDSKLKACKRYSNLKELFQYVDLHEQVTSVANLLQNVGKYDYYVYKDPIESFTNKVVEEYHKVLARKTKLMQDCNLRNQLNGAMEILLIFDGTWQQYQAQRIIAYITEEADMSYYGSKIGLINGQNGQWMTNVTSDIVQFYSELENSTTKWPTTLTLSSALNTATFFYEKQKNCTSKLRKQRPISKSILVFSYASRITDEDFKDSQYSLDAIRRLHPSARVVFATSVGNGDTFQKLAGTPYDSVVTSNDDKELVLQAINKIQNTPAPIVDLSCNQPVLYEDYLTPDIPKIYEIPHQYLEDGDVTIKFHENGYSSLVVLCTNSSNAELGSCKSLTGKEDEVIFRAKEICSEPSCTIYFTATASNSTFRCTELDCRYPDQVRIDISSQYSTASTITYTSTLTLIFVTFLYIIKYI